MAIHPFDPITVPELTKATAMLKAHHKGKLLHIKTGERDEPVSNIKPFQIQATKYLYIYIYFS